MKDQDYEVGKWYPWNQGDRPVHEKTTVKVMYICSGRIETDALRARNFTWNSIYSPIIAFKVIEHYKEPREWTLMVRDHDNDVYVSRNPDAYPVGGYEKIRVREILDE